MQHWQTYAIMLCVSLSLYPSSLKLFISIFNSKTSLFWIKRLYLVFHKFRQLNRCSTDIDTLKWYAFQNCRYTRAVMILCVSKLSLNSSSYYVTTDRQTDAALTDIHTLFCYAFQNCRYTRAVIMLCLSKLLTLTLTLTLTFHLDLWPWTLTFPQKKLAFFWF